MLHDQAKLPIFTAHKTVRFSPSLRLGLKPLGICEVPRCHLEEWNTKKVIGG
jgi:hypothetical protein